MAGALVRTSYICQVNLPSSNNNRYLCCAKDKRGRRVTLVSNGSPKVQIICESAVKMVYDCGTSVQHLTLEEDNDELLWWCATASGKIHQIDLPKLRTKKKKGRSKTSKTTDKDIFSELLGEEASKQPQGISAVDVTQLDDQSVVLHLDAIQKLCALKEHVLTLQKSLSGWTLSVYLKKHLKRRNENISEVSPLKTVHIPTSSVVSCSRFPDQNDNRNYNLNRPSLFCVCPTQEDEAESDRIRSRTDASSTCIMAKNVFNTLFGVEANLLSCPIAIVGTPDGRIYSVPLKDIPTSGSHPSQKLLCQLSQCPVAIYGACLLAPKDDLVPSEPTHVSDSLLFVGRDGKILVMSGGNGHMDYKEIYITGPVLCSGIHGNWLLHSTGRDLYRTNISSAKDCAPHQFLTSLPCGLASVICLGVPQAQRAAEGAAPVNLVIPVAVINKRGCVYSAVVDPTQTSGHPAVSGSGGQKMKDMLTSIQRLSVAVGQVQQKLDQHNNVLSQLSLGSVLATKTARTSGISVCQPDMPLGLDIRVHQHDLGTHLQHTVIARLDNRSTVPLEQGWSLVLNMRGGNREQNRPDSTSIWHATKSLCLKPMSPGAFHELHILLQTEAIHSLPLTIVPSLIFTTDGLQLTDHNFHVDEHSAVFANIYLPSKVLDILHFLVPVSKGISEPRTVTSLGETWASHLRSMSEISPAMKLHSCDLSTGTSEHKEVRHFSADICLTELTVLRIIGNLVKTEEKSEVLLLRHILDDSSLVGAVQHAHIRAVSPDGHQMSLVVQQSETTASQPTEPYVLTIQVPNLPLLCQMRLAVIQRITACLQTISMEKKEKPLSARELRIMLKEVEEIRWEASSLQDATLDGRTNSKVEEQTKHLYQKLCKLKILL